MDGEEGRRTKDRRKGKFCLGGKDLKNEEHAQRLKVVNYCVAQLCAKVLTP